DGWVRVRFEVQDTGIGIRPEARERIFESFTQADGSTTRQFGGTGLGLSIARQLTQMMGGQIGVDSEPEEGSRFWFTIRLRRSEERPAPAVVPEAAQPDSGRAGHRPRVLLTEDNSINLEVAQSMLEALGCVVETAGDGQQALLALSRNVFDI